jgi:hypothetical protein
MYKVTIQPNNIWKPAKVRKVIALDAENAKEIVKVYNKDCFIETAVRIGSEPSTKKVLERIKDDFETALKDGNKELASRHEKAFYATVSSLEASMGAAQWSMTKRKIPTLSPLGK